MNFAGDTTDLVRGEEVFAEGTWMGKKSSGTDCALVPLSLQRRQRVEESYFRNALCKE